MTGLLLSVATPAWVAVANGLEPYLLHPMLFGAQAAPYLLAGLLWLPRRSEPAARAGLVLAILLLSSAVVVYVPMLTGLVPMGGDMVALAFIAIDAVTLAGVLVASGVAWAVVRRRS